VPTTEQLQQSTQIICKVIGQISCFHICEEFVLHRFSTSTSEVSLSAITRNAALDSALISLRCFNEFFANTRQKDDIRANDFPGVKMQPFLPPDDVNAIHKYLAHITVIRADMVTKPWFLDEMVILGLNHGIKFLSTIETTFPPATDEGRAELREVREVAVRLVRRIAERNKSNVAT
jgi:hypothetical protein